jgi:hyperosmotically inducible protein
MNGFATALAALLITAVPVAASAQTTTDKVEKKAERAADKVEQKTERAGDKIEQKTEKAESRTKATAAKAGTAVKDSWITSKTKIALFGDERVSGTDINVQTRNGVITLRGKVATSQEKMAAEEIAKSIDGVASVKNQLQVVASGARKAVDAKDDDLTKSVKSRISKDTRLKGSDIEVRADNGVVTLTGDAKDLGARARASELARSVPGVKSVKNEIKEKS